jgi:putative ABC transport system permease protein
MRFLVLVRRALRYYWRTNLAVVVGVATAVAVLAGALLVGDSVRGSLRDLVLQRLGRTDRVVLSTGFFREALAADIASDPSFRAVFDAVCPLIAVPGMVSDPESGRRVSRVQVYGVDDRFWRFHRLDGSRAPSGREALLSRALASDLGAAPGHAVLVRVERPSAIPIESLHGRKDNLGRALRLTARAILDPTQTGDFSLQPQQGEVRAVFVPLRRLQEDLEVVRQANVLLVADSPSRHDLGESQRAAAIEDLIRRRFALDDVALTVRGSTDLIVGSAAGLLDEPRVRAVDEAAAASGLKPQPVFTYLANTMRSQGHEVPYSLVTALDLSLVAPDMGKAADASSSPPIVVNEWTARDLGAHVGDPLTLEYYLWQEPGRLVTQSADFRIAGIVPIAGLAASRDLAPVYPGITEAKTLGNWDPPFPIDLHRVRKADEDYWDTYRTTPKAFIPLAVGQRLWGSRFGNRSSVRLAPASGQSVDEAHDRFAAALRARINPTTFGLVVQGVRAEGLRASRGATDFGEYFTYFSFFLVASALLLAALFFRLTVEQRARETGLLRAVGFSPARVRRLLLAEGLLLAIGGALLGVGGAVAYGELMMVGLRRWWSGAVGTTALTLHVTWVSLAAGAAGAVAAAMVCIWWTLRRLSRLSERNLLAGNVAQPRVGGPGTRHAASYAALGSTVVAIVLLAAGASGSMNRTAAFFGSGTLLLISCLSVVAIVLRRPPRSALDASGRWPIYRIGMRNAADRPGRSILAIGVIASATFLLVAVGAFRRTPQPPGNPHTGTGGYRLLVDLLVPLVSDPNSRDGREALGVGESDAVRIEPFRVLPGDDASCLNLYEPGNPRILGLSPAFMAAGRFAFQSSLASTDEERANPWLLLNRDAGRDVVPVIADANSMTYVLHKNLGDEIVTTRGGDPVRLRLVAALADSIFQRELLMSDANFVRLFPQAEGYRFLLIDAAGGAGRAGGEEDRVREIEAAIEQGASDLGADAVETSARLAEFHTVENTYLATFQALGGLGLLVGTLGLTAIILRNVLERRRELALLGAVGYGPRQIFAIVIAENLWLLAWGLAIGAACALVAIAPAALERGSRLPATPAGAAMLFAVFLAGLLSSAVATRAALRTPLLEALRSE